MEVGEYHFLSAFLFILLQLKSDRYTTVRVENYKRVHAIFQMTSIMTRVNTAMVLSSTGLGISLSGIGVIISAPHTGIARLLGFISTAITVGSKRLNKKITKHEKTVSLAESSNFSISKLISKALNDRPISDVEFDLIPHKVQQYY